MKYGFCRTPRGYCLAVPGLLEGLGFHLCLCVLCLVLIGCLRGVRNNWVLSRGTDTVFIFFFPLPPVDYVTTLFGSVIFDRLTGLKVWQSTRQFHQSKLHAPLVWANFSCCWCNALCRRQQAPRVRTVSISLLIRPPQVYVVCPPPRPSPARRPQPSQLLPPPAKSTPRWCCLDAAPGWGCGLPGNGACRTGLQEGEGETQHRFCTPPTPNEERRMKNEECKLNNESWKMEYGKWRVKNKEWKMRNGKWKMENESCFWFFFFFEKHMKKVQQLWCVCFTKCVVMEWSIECPRLVVDVDNASAGSKIAKPSSGIGIL